MTRQLLHGNWIFPEAPDRIRLAEDGFLLAEDGVILSLTRERPEGCDGLAVEEFGDQLLIPPFIDLHLHAVQYMNRGLGLDMTLLDWLRTYTYPEESRFADPLYAEQVFDRVCHELWYYGSLRSVIFSSLHREATLILMRKLSEAGLCAYVGKVNMDRNNAPELRETTAESLANTLAWLDEAEKYAPGVQPIITPRFIPSCTPELLQALGELVRERQLPVQSHLNETPEEVDWVRELCPDCANYLEAYEKYGLLPQGRTIMAHCIYNLPDEEKLLKERRITIAHCPSSNMNLGSGIARVREYLEAGMSIGLGSDISGGETLCMQQVIRDTLKSSALLARKRRFELKPLSFRQIFYMATRGGDFFGSCGSFEPGMPLDFLAVDDRALRGPGQRTLEERLQQFMYLGSGAEITKRVLAGRELPEPLWQA